jgi:hypothetical protein
MLMPSAKEPPGLSRKTMADRMLPIVCRNVASSPLFNLPLMVTSAGYMTPSSWDKTLISAACADVARSKAHNAAVAFIDDPALHTSLDRLHGTESK